jgi:hypothetical protein
MKITIIVNLKQNPDDYECDPVKAYMDLKNALGSAISCYKEVNNRVLVSATVEPSKFRGDKIDWSLGETD